MIGRDGVGTVSALTSGQRATLLAVAEDAIATMLCTDEALVVDERLHEPALRADGATFVTLERGESLLGCIGTLERVRPLICDIAHNAIAAAFADPRLPAIDGDDYEVMSVEISVLSELEPLAATSLDMLASELRPGIDGLVVDAPTGRATFLPRCGGTSATTSTASSSRSGARRDSRPAPGP